MPSLSTVLPVLEDALFAMIRTTLTTNSSGVQTQQWAGCTPTDTMKPLVSVWKHSVKAGMAHPLLVWVAAVMKDSWIRA
eukprot:1146749-Pelagomonas_calceolata.AAC.2